MSIEKMAIKANELREEGHTTREIGQEMHLSKATIEWLLAKQASSDFSEKIPPDVKVGWRSIGVSGSRINSIASAFDFKSGAKPPSSPTFVLSPLFFRIDFNW